MKDPRREYEAALADFSQPGNRWMAKGRLTYWGKAAGLTADEIISDARAAGVTDRNADIRRGWNDAKPKGRCPQGNWRQNDWRNYAPRTKPKPTPMFPRYVRDMVTAGDGEATSADLLALSPFVVPKDGRTQTAAFLRSLFDPADVLHVFRDDAPTAGKPGQNLMPCRNWLAMLERGERMNGDLIVANVFSGAEANTTDGRKSYIAQSCLASFLVYSGGKSIHGLLHVGCRMLEDWQTVRGQLRGLLAADPDPTFRADEQAMRPRTGTRLPGVHRFDNGRRQTLLYLNPETVRPTAKKQDAQTVRIEPRETPQARPTLGTGKETFRADGRATGQIFALPCDCAPVPPTPPPDNAPFDEILAHFDMIESMA